MSSNEIKNFMEELSVEIVNFGNLLKYFLKFN